MKCRFVLTLLFLAGSMSAQSITFDAFKIADILITATWKNTEENMLPALIQQLEKTSRDQGATDQAAKVLAIETRKALSKDSMAQAVAQYVASTMSIDEQKQTVAFLQSTAGAKYLDLSSGSENSLRFVLPMLKHACVAANAQLGFLDRGSLSKSCQ